MKRFISFTESLKRTRKVALRNVFVAVKNDCQSTTGSNLRKVMLAVGKNLIQDLKPDDAFSIQYCPVLDENQYGERTN